MRTTVLSVLAILATLSIQLVDGIHVWSTEVLDDLGTADVLEKPPQPLLFCAEDKQRVPQAVGALGVDVTQKSGTPQAVRLAQYNVWNFNDGPDWLERRSKSVFEVLLREKPDVIALNEIRISSNQSMFMDFCEKLGQEQYQGVFAPAMVYPNGVIEGVALFSKIPWKAVSSRSLHFRKQQTQDENKRVILGAHICLEHSSCLMVYSTHFSFDEKQRFGNAFSAYVFMIAFGLKHNAEAQIVLMGDLNSSNGTQDQVTLFFDSVLRLSDPAGIKTTPEMTYCNCGRDENQCILNSRPDRILVHYSLEVTELSAGPKGLVNQVCPSDHRAVFATVLVDQTS